jgi:hypothetical protein
MWLRVVSMCIKATTLMFHNDPHDCNLIHLTCIRLNIGTIRKIAQQDENSNNISLGLL